jgi:hypothetical protein
VNDALDKLVTAARHSSESAEHFTPAWLVDAARATLGGSIDLDPASCVEANAWIRASRIFTAEEDGFVRPWWGRVLLNPPGGLSDDQQRPVKIKCRETGGCGLAVPHTHEGIESSQKKWWFKAAREYTLQRVEAAIFVCFSVELLQTTQNDTPVGLPIPLDFPICFPSKRVSYVKPGGKVGTAPPHASCIVLLGPQEYQERFEIMFSPIGRVIGVQR